MGRLAGLARSLRPGDRLVLAAGVLLVAGLMATLWGGGGRVDKVVVRSAGQVVAELDPLITRQLAIAGPLGVSRVEVLGGRARVAADPGPRQHCVRQGWLSRPGEVALCLPNQVSVEMRAARRSYDSLNY